jgi:UDP-glucose 6-dehydrogenase
MDRWLSGNTDEMRQERLALLVQKYLRTSTKVQILTPEEMRQERREQVLSTTAKDFAAFGEKLEIVSKSGTIAIVGSANAFEPDDVKALGLETKKLL